MQQTHRMTPDRDAKNAISGRDLPLPNHRDPLKLNLEERRKRTLLHEGGEDALSWVEFIFIPAKVMSIVADTRAWAHSLQKDHRTTPRNWHARPRAAQWGIPLYRAYGDTSQVWHSLYTPAGHWIFHGPSLAAQVFRGDSSSTKSCPNCQTADFTPYPHRMQQLTLR